MAGTQPEVTLRFMAAPTDAGLTGTVDGGRVLEWIDKSGYACAVGWAGTYCVTAYVGNIKFAQPVRIGDIVEVQSRLVYTGRSSMHIVTTVASGDPRTGDLTVATQCLSIFVAVGTDGRPTPVPTFTPVDDWEREQHEIARKRIDLRADIEASMADQVYSDAGTAPRTVLRFLAAPTDINWGGKVHGGTVMRWIDDAAHVVASGWHGGRTIAAYAGGVRFYRPLLIGDLVEVDARLVHTGTTSMHLSVHVRSGDPKTGELNLTTHCMIVFVALDEQNHKVAVRTWEPVSEEDAALDEHARYVIGVRERLRRQVPADPPASRAGAR
ncbi:acyl-CoA thioesterase [Tersicoccus solisilvae]|uniref:Acyl-CoA thioesterase n=1 Tax=Tersicoccus solisilvae TaxID=1882339 RepID=A0ABQ1NZ26_9MICC|nr:acyl-CoA thioesterase [Tersicoccus solisilvae]GGC87762.1 acyl-CoA thioesterase [Tersicoccus solisilvae]